MNASMQALTVVCFSNQQSTSRQIRPIRMSVLRTIPTTIPTLIALIAWATLNPVPMLVASDSGTPATSKSSTSLSADQVVDNLVRKNQERAQALLHSEGTRVYHLSYRGFPGDRDAEMTVEATYDSPSTKEFKVISESGSKLILNRVFKKLLEGEKEAAQPAVSARTQLNRDNYTFELLAYEPSNAGGQYVLGVTPKSRSKYVYRGKVWVDGTDFAVTHLEAEPVRIRRSGQRRVKFITNTRRSEPSGYQRGMNRSATFAWEAAPP